MKALRPRVRAMRPAIPKILLLLESSRASGRALLSGVARYAHLHGPWSFYWEPAGLEKVWPLLETLDADGIILRDVEKVDEVIAAGIPAVVVGHSRTEIPGLVNVVTDSAVIGRMAAEHLLNCGCRHFGYCGLTHSGIEQTHWSQQRGESYRERLEGTGFTVAVYEEPTAKAALSWGEERQFMARWLEGLPKPVGVMACNDDRGQQVVEACRMAHLEVPDQVAVIGVDNDELLCGFCEPAMSSVALNFELAGYQSAESLDRLIRRRKGKLRKIVVGASHVVMRRSTSVLAVEDPFVAQAMRFIRDHNRENLSVVAVARAVGLSRRALEKRFRRSFARSIFSEVRRVRVEQIVQFLAGTNHTIAEIADLMDFESPQHIARYFRAEKGVTPREFRRQCARC